MMTFKQSKHLIICTTFVLVFIITSCTQNGDKAKLTHKPVNHTVHKTISKNKDLNIDFPCAVLVSPDDRNIEKLKKTNSADDYDIIVDDNVNYMNESGIFLDSVKIKQIQRESHGMLYFKGTNGITFAMNLDTLNWAIILFNGKDKPVNADMTDINDEYAKYMQK